MHYYDDRVILNEITEEPVNLVFDESLRNDTILGKRKRNLKNVMIKIDPLQIKATKKLSTMKRQFNHIWHSVIFQLGAIGSH
jgi:hypothetical protein